MTENPINSFQERIEEIGERFQIVNPQETFALFCLELHRAANGINIEEHPYLFTYPKDDELLKDLVGLYYRVSSSIASEGLLIATDETLQGDLFASFGYAIGEIIRNLDRYKDTNGLRLKITFTTYNTEELGNKDLIKEANLSTSAYIWGELTLQLNFNLNHRATIELGFDNEFIARLTDPNDL